MHRRYLVLLLVLSGTCGLAYELIWVRMLSLSFGSTTLSFSTVIAVFLGGLALGAWLCGRSPRALARPVVTYALLELCTGVIGLISYPVLRALPEAFSYIDPGVGPAGLLARLVVSIVVLLPPTLLMGATLPAACAACVHDDARLGGATAILYGVNTLGACLGTYGVTFVLFPNIGLDGAVYATVAINIVVGVIALVAERLRFDVHVEGATTPAATAAAAPRVRGDRRPYVIAFLAGLAAVAAQVVWSRLFSSLLAGTVYGVGSVLVAILVGIGLGSLIVSRTLKTEADAARAFVIAHVVLIGSLLAFWSGLPWIQYEIQVLGFGLQGQALIHAQLAWVVAVLVVPAAASGAILPILVRIVAHRAAGVPGALSRLYAFNTIGSVIGSLAGGFVLIPNIGTAGTAYLTTILVALTLALGAIAYLGRSGSARYLVALAAVASAAVFPDIDVIRTFVPVSARQSIWDHADAAASARSRTLFVAEGTVASVLVGEDKQTRSLSLNGLGQGSYTGHAPHHLLESVLVALMPTIHAHRTHDALVVGLGAGITVDVLLDLGVEHIRVLELEPAVVDAQPAIFGRAPPTDHPRVEVVLDDARHHLLVNARSTKRFDLIAAMPAHPWVAASVFTREFFEIAHANLANDGVFGAWFGLTRVDDELVQSILSAFSAAFPFHVVYRVPEAGALYLVGSPSPIQLDPARVTACAQASAVRESAAAIGTLDFYLSRVLTVGRGDALSPAANINTDVSMYVEMNAPLMPTTTTTISLAGLSAAGLDIAILPEAARAPALDLRLETLLGTPEGRWLPVDRPQPDLVALRRLLASSRAVLGERAAQYFELRARLATREAGVPALLDALARSATDTYAARASGTAVAIEPDVQRRRERIQQLVDSGAARSDVWFRALGEPSEAAAMTRAATSTLSVAADPLGWLLAAAHGARVAEAAVGGGEGLRALTALVTTTRDERVIELCRRAAASSGLRALTQFCERRSAELRRLRSRRAVEQAVGATRRHDFEGARRAFEAASALEPLDLRALDLYLDAAGRLGNQRQIAEISDILRTRGVPEGVIDERVRRALFEGVGGSEPE